MVARSTRPVRRTAKAAPAARKAAPVKAKADVTEYATKPATPYHKAFAKWIVTEVGFDPDSVSSKRAAFLKGVSIATAARPKFNESDFLEEWRETSGEAKRGPKPKAAVAEEAPTRRRKAAAPVEVEEEDDFEDDDEIEDDEIDSDDDDDFEDDDEESDDDDDEEDDEEEAPAPVKRGPGRPRKAAPAPAARGRKAAPAKASTRRTAKAADDDEFLF